MSVKLIKRTMTAMAVGMTSLLSASVFAGDLQDIKDSGVLRHEVARTLQLPNTATNLL